MTEKTLALCPFCPQPDVLTLIVETEFVSCTKCGCQGPVGKGYSDVISRWNTQTSARVPDPRIDAAQSLADALQDAGELLEEARAMLGCCGEGDGKDRHADAEFPGSIASIRSIKAALAAWEKATE